MRQTVSLEEIIHYMAPYEVFFSRSEARDLASRYVWGLVFDGYRKSAGSMSGLVGVQERSLQRLLTQVKWDSAGVYDAYIHHMVDSHYDPDGILVAGQTVFPKRGGHSVCVARQYSEELGRMVSSQVAMEIVFVGRNGSWPFAMELYMPVFWDKRRDTGCRLQREKAQIPKDVHHVQQWELVLDMVQHAREMLPSSHVLTAGKTLGDIAGFRDSFDRTGQGYLVEVPENTEVFLERPELEEVKRRQKKRGRPRKRSCTMEAVVPPVRVSALNTNLEKGCDSLSTAEGSRCFSRLGRVWPAHGYRDGIVHAPVHLIAGYRESAGCVSAQGYYLANVPEESMDNDIRRILAAQNRAVLCKQDMIHRLGLLHHEGRSWTGWHRHVLLVFLAWEFLLEGRVSLDESMNNGVA